jgi:hypothetical protein
MYFIVGKGNEAGKAFGPQFRTHQQPLCIGG